MADRIRHGRRAGFIKTAARLAVVLALIAALCAGMAGGAAAAERPERWKVDPESLPESLSAFLDYFCWYGMFGANEFSSSQIGEYNSVMGGQFELCVDFDSYPGEATEQWIQSDPRGRWGSCYAYDGEKTEWILMNVFNYSSKNILDTRARGDDPSRDYYYEDGTYYVYQGGVGGGFICYPCYAETDGEKYYVNYMIYSGDGYISLDGMGFAVVKPFEADGREYWSLSYWAGQIMELGEAPRELTEVLKGCEGRWVLEDDEASSLTIGAPDGLMTDIGARFSGMAEFSAFALLMDESSMVFFDYDSGFSGWMDLGEDEITMHVIPLPDFWDPSGYGEYFDGPFVFLRASGDVPSGPGSGAFSITPEELERELEIIRSAFYNPTGDDERITLVKGTDGWDYSRDYTFHNGRLVFAFIFDGTEEHRLYFKDDHMIRYIDEYHTVYDFGSLEPFQYWADWALEEAYALRPRQDAGDPAAVDPGAWLGTWVGDGGESLEVIGATDSGITLIYNGWMAAGDEMFHSQYDLPFTDGSRRTAAEPEEYIDSHGWRYVFTLNGDSITMSSRYPDRYFYKQ